MAREAKELAKQRAALEAALAAERVDAQGHGYTPTPLVTPKPVQVGDANLSQRLPAEQTVFLWFDAPSLILHLWCLTSTLLCFTHNPELNGCTERVFRLSN